LKRDYDRVIFAPVPYSAGYMDLTNHRFRSPLDKQEVKHWRFRHWLGTDQLGRDVLAGMIHGARSALVVGLFGTGIAVFIGILLGGCMGFFGDDRLRAGPMTFVGVASGLTLGFFYGSYAVNLLSGLNQLAWIGGLMTGTGVWVILSMTGYYTDRRLGWLRWRLTLDLLLMRLVEAVQAMPGMLLLLALIPLFLVPSVWNVVLIVGLIRWPGVTRFVRGEMLRIRALPYIEAAEGSGISLVRIFWRHALPNALQPVLVVAAFSISSGVLLEAFLSFLGLGLPSDQVSWGSLLNQARKHFDAWWLAVFPGIGIFAVVTSCNLIGDALQEWLDRRKSYL
jgi:peptide/nickel transport system permease protein